MPDFSKLNHHRPLIITAPSHESALVFSQARIVDDRASDPDHTLTLNTQVDIKAMFNENRIAIERSMGSPLRSDLFQQKTREIIDLQDKMIREALIKLGWTPPPAGFVPKKDDERAECDHDWVSDQSKVMPGEQICLHCQDVREEPEPESQSEDCKLGPVCHVCSERAIGFYRDPKDIKTDDSGSMVLKSPTAGMKAVCYEHAPEEMKERL